MKSKTPINFALFVGQNNLFEYKMVIPTINNDPKDIRQMCEWIRENIGVETPLHFSSFLQG